MAVSRATCLGLGALLCTLFLAGCQRIETLLAIFRNRDLEFLYTGDGTSVERASVSSNTRVIATARRIQTGPTTDEAVTELEIEETHFTPGTPNVVYTGRVVFRCRSGEGYCAAARVMPTSGTRARDLFWRWPASMATGTPQPARRP